MTPEDRGHALPWQKQEIGSWWQFILIMLIIRFFLLQSTEPLNSVIKLAIKLADVLVMVLLIFGARKIVRYLKTW